MATVNIKTTFKHYASRALLEAATWLPKEWTFNEGLNEIQVRRSDNVWSYLSSRTESTASINLSAYYVADVDESLTIRYTIRGKEVTVTIPTTSFTTGGYSGMSLRLHDIPAAIRPSNTLYHPIYYVNNGANGLGTIKIANSADWYILPSSDPESTQNAWRSDSVDEVGVFRTALHYRLD